MQFKPIPAALHEKLQAIQPSRDGEMAYFPCRVRLRDGRVLDRVYVQPVQPYLKYWGVAPEEDPGKLSVRVEDIVDLEESPARLPPRFADTLYQAGELGMGYTTFVLEFRDGSTLPVVTGNAVDFVPVLPGFTPNDVVRVHPHKGRGEGPRSAPDYYWALFDGIQAPT